MLLTHNEFLMSTNICILMKIHRQSVKKSILFLFTNRLRGYRNHFGYSPLRRGPKPTITTFQWPIHPRYKRHNKSHLNAERAVTSPPGQIKVVMNQVEDVFATGYRLPGKNHSLGKAIAFPHYANLCNRPIRK